MKYRNVGGVFGKAGFRCIYHGLYTLQTNGGIHASNLHDGSYGKHLDQKSGCYRCVEADRGLHLELKAFSRDFSEMSGNTGMHCNYNFYLI